MKTIALKAEKRTETGKQGAKRLRRCGQIPGIYYGAGFKAQPLAVDEKELLAVLGTSGSENIGVDLRIGDGKGRTYKAIIRDIQYDPVTGRIVHVDFQHIAMDKPVHVAVAIHLEGVAVGVKNKGGILEHLKREVEISCLPKDIPEFITVDISGLDIVDSIRAKDLDIPNATLLSDPELVIATVVPPVIQKEVTPAVEEGEGEEAKEKAAAEEEPEQSD